MGRVVAAVVAAIVLIAGAVLLITWPEPAPVTTAPPVVPVVPFGPLDAQRLEGALRSGDADQVTSVVALSDGEEIAPGFVAALAAMDLRVDGATFTPQDPTTATVLARTTSTSWVLIIRAVTPGSTWQLVSTVAAP